jgi:signal transduction histidine kinase
MLIDREHLSDRMTAVLGFSELLLEGAYGPLEPQQRRVLEDVVEAARDLKEMIRAEKRSFSLD